MPSSNPKEMGIYERLGQLDQKITAAHNRVDKVEGIIREDLKELKTELNKVVAWMNRSLGWAAALLFVGGIIGTLITIVLKK